MVQAEHYDISQQVTTAAEKVTRTEIKAPASAIDRVKSGLVMVVRFRAFKQALTPKVLGKFINLSAERLTHERSGIAYYQAQIELKPESYIKLRGLVLLPEMPAEVFINTSERTVFEYLMQLITNAFARVFIED